MKKLCSQMGWWLLFASIGISLSAWTSDTPSYAGQSGAAGLAIEDTTVVSCEKADSSYGFWISTLQLQILSNYPGSVIAVSPTPPLSYVFSGNCSDTLVFDFQITPPSGPDTTETYVFIVRDTVAPKIKPSLPDSFALGCQDPIPDSTSVTITDNCALDTVIYQEAVEGSGNCPFSFKIIRTWDAYDVCGNTTSYRQVITVSDETAPAFANFPADITIDCSIAPTPENTGTPEVTDLCDTDPKVSYFDQEFPTLPGCGNDYTIRRTWVAEDTCNNVNFRPQTIRIRDMKAPTFTAPRDTVLSCTDGDDPSVAGVPTNVVDNCAQLDEDNVRYEDVLISSPCPNTYTVHRTWYVFDDCGNTDSVLQVVQVLDDQPPVFSRLARDLTIQCTEELDPETLFWEWANRFGDALASDNCGGGVRWIAQNAGTSDTLSFPALQCLQEDQVILERRVDFIAEDACGLKDTTTAVFRVVDLAPPSLVDCPKDTAVATSPGICSANFPLPNPQIEDECYFSTTAFAQTRSEALVSSDPSKEPGETKVAPLRFAFNLPSAAWRNAAGPATLDIRLFSVDGEAEGEYFLILGEDGQFLGRSALTPAQCGNSDTTLSVSAAQLDQWGADGVIELWAIPNLGAEQPGRFAVNPICSGGRVEAQLAFDLKDLAGISLAYRLNQGPPVAFSPSLAPSVELPLGRNEIQYLLTDCGGNTDSCSFVVVVEDREAPQLICPSDTLVVLPAEACTIELELPLPLGATDNCTVLGSYQKRLPADTSSALLTFNYDPNLNSYLANGKMFAFDGLGANATDSATLIIRYKGDFSTPNAFLEILGEGGALLGATPVGGASCNQEGVLTLLLPPSLVNSWASDGQILIAVNPFNIATPSGQANEGINPCQPGTVTSNGQNDGNSYVFAELTFPTISPSYYATGATPLPLTPVRFPEVIPRHTFNQGVTEVFYIIADALGNTDTCSFQINVADQQPPIARCQPTTLFINPAGLENPVVSAQEINAGSGDNCGIDTMILSPNTFNCLQAGMVQNVTLTVTDKAGNMAQCSTIVRIENLEPQPDASSELCGSDTLFLRANPPQANGGIIYTYKWTGPNNFVSNKENPVIPNVNSRNAGSYVVEITGLTGCKATGVVEVSIEDLPLTPDLVTRNNFCEEDDIVLTSSLAPSGGSVTYRWYRGVPPSGVLIGSTIVPSLTLPGPHGESANSYYLVIEANGCASRPSSPVVVRVNKKPVAIPREESITVCEGESVMLGTEVSGTGITYEWTGPNGYASSSQFPSAIMNASPVNSGVYKLIVSRFGCPSAPAFVSVTVLPKPVRPEISNTGPVCAGTEVALQTNASATIYTWISPGLQEFSTSENRFVVSNASNEIEGPWRLYITRQGCRSDVSLPTSLVVNDLPRPTVATSPAVICEGATLNLNASPDIPNATYRWAGPNSFNAVGVNARLDNARVQNTGRYTVTVITQEGCAGSAFTDVEIKRGVRIIAVTNDGPDCLNGPTDIRLSASVFPEDDGTYAYRWTGPNGYLSTSNVGLIPNATQLNNGNYQLIVTTTQGCPSNPASTVVNVKDPPRTPGVPRINEGLSLAVCEGTQAMICTDAYQGTEVQYHWITPNEGIIVTSTPCLSIPAASVDDAGAYAVFVTVDGCRSKSSGNTNLTVNPTPVIAASNNSPVCAGLALELKATVLSGATYRWSGPNFTSSLALPLIPSADSAAHAGLYTVIAEVNGCPSAPVTTQVTVLPVPRQPALEPAGPVCISAPNATLSLRLQEDKVTPGASYTWFGPNGQIATTSAPALLLANFAGFSNGSNGFHVQARLGSCTSSLSPTLPVVLNTIPEDLAFAGNDFTACDAEAIFLRGEEPTLGSGRWTLKSGPNPSLVQISTPNKAITAVNGLAGPNEYVFTWTLSNGACADYSADDVRLVVNRQDTAFAGDDILTCLAPQISLAARPSANGSGTWSQSAVQAQLGVRVLEPGNPNTPVGGMQPGNLYSFTWTIVGGCGVIQDEVFVLISDPNPYAGQDQSVCTLFPEARLNADEPTEGSRGKWRALDANTLIDDPLSLQPLASNLQPGENRFVWEIDEGICDALSRDTVTIRFTRSPEALDDNIPVAFGEPTQLPVLKNDVFTGKVKIRILESPTKGTLEMQGDTGIVYRPGFKFVGTDRLVYELCSDGCACTTAEVLLGVGGEANCSAPSVITPNNDGTNDEFIVPCLLEDNAYPNSQVLIFNRWGDEVFRSKRPYQNNWSGTFNGEELPVGTYFYVVDFGDGSTPLRGFIVIQR